MSGGLEIPLEFKDDGCSSFIDGLSRYSFKKWCRMHDWCGCTRCHPPGSLTEAKKQIAAWELREHMRQELPWYLDWTVAAVFRVVYIAWGYWDSCGPEAGERCRHNMPMPAWMVTLEAQEPRSFLRDGGADL